VHSKIISDIFTASNLISRKRAQRTPFVVSEMNSCRLRIIKIGRLMFNMHYVVIEEFSEEQNGEETL
jgi:hypothetical protein